MQRVIVLFLFLFMITSARGQESDNYPVYDFDGFAEAYLKNGSDSLYVINFWATWCAPCVEEMPAFRKAQETLKDEKVRFVLASLDFGRNVEDRVKTFARRHELKAEIVILDDPDSNSWINRVDPSWSGALPATIMLQGDRSSFYEQTFHYEELLREIRNNLKP